MTDITFEPLAESHFGLLLHWLEKPHVKAWWDKDIKWTPSLIQKKYADYINGYKKLILQGKMIKNPIYAFIIVFKKIPIGYIQYYNVHDFPREQSYYDTLELPVSCAGLDWYIGETVFIGKGVGTKAFDGFLKQHIFPSFNYVFVDPDTDNITAISVYKKIGFEVIKKVNDGRIMCMLYSKYSKAS